MRFLNADSRIPFAMIKEAVTYYLTYDQAGSLRTVSDSTGNIVKRLDYDSFGNIINDTNTGFKVPFGFAGGLLDRDTGLIRFGYRDYDPDVGRWAAKDPILFAGGDTDLYGYVLNDPVNLIDPWGLLGNSYNSYGYFHGYGNINHHPKYTGLSFQTKSRAEKAKAINDYVNWYIDHSCPIMAFRTPSRPLL